LLKSEVPTERNGHHETAKVLEQAERGKGHAASVKRRRGTGKREIE
jgi:hypothetical protein